MVVVLFITSLLYLFLPINALASPHGSGPRHHELARRVGGNMQLYHRSPGARMTFYNTETGSAGSCGTFLTNTGFTVALSAADMNSELCFKMITITYNGRSTTAQLMDTCPGCPPGCLDLSPALFDYFVAPSVGVFYADWEYVDAAPPSPSPSPSPTPTPTPTPTPPSPPPSSVWSPSPSRVQSPPPSPVWSPSVWSLSPSPSSWSTSYTSTPSSTKSNIPPTSSHISSPSSLSSSSSVSSTSSTPSINYSSGLASGLAEPEPTGDILPQEPGNNFDELNRVFICLGGLVLAAQGD